MWGESRGIRLEKKHDVDNSEHGRQLIVRTALLIEAHEGKPAFADFSLQNVNNKTGNQAANAKQRQTNGSRWK